MNNDNQPISPLLKQGISSVNDIEIQSNEKRGRSSFFNNRKACLVLVITITAFIIFYYIPMQTFHKSFRKNGEITSLTSNEREDDSTKPIMYTFYTVKKEGGPGTLGDQALLKLWTEKWNEAGWNAKILTIDDAKKHPRFEEFDEILKKVPLKENNLVYNRLCYYRWLAMAATGGGWMSDIDVLPTFTFDNPDEYFKDGRFAIYSKTHYGGIPCLMSGSESEWERLAFAVVENGAKHTDEWSDMLSSVDIYRNNHDMYELYNLILDMKYSVWNENTCRRSSGKIAVHFSHHGVQRMGLRDINKRAEFANDYLNDWKSSCFS